MTLDFAEHYVSILVFRRGIKSEVVLFTVGFVFGRK